MLKSVSKRPYIRIVKSPDKEFSNLSTQLNSLCDQIMESENEIAYYPSRGNVLAVIGLMGHGKFPYEVKTDFDDLN